jgi:toxin FitB
MSAGGYLLDTNCVSELVSRRPEQRVIRWLDAADEASLFLSVLTLGEIRKGAARLPQGRRRQAIENWLEFDLKVWFAGRVLPIDAAIADRWGLIVSQMEKTGRVFPVIDSLLAATALEHNLTIVSRNAIDFPNVRVFSPWRTS